MKILYIVIGIVVITLVCFPALANSKADLISQYKGQSSPTIPTPIPTSTPTLDMYHVGVWIYPHIPASYYEWSKFPPEPTPRIISDEEWEEAMAKFYEYMAKHDAIRVLA